MKVVMEALRDLNPIRLLAQADPDPLLQVNGIDMTKLKIPVNYFSQSFFDKFAERTKLSKKEIGKELGADVEKRKEGDWASIGNMLKLGKKKDLRIGDYIHFLGLDLKPYEQKYDTIMQEVFIRIIFKI